MPTERNGHRTRQGSTVGRPNTLNLSVSALDEVFDRLDQNESGVSAKRKHVRWPFRLESVSIRVEHPGGNSVTLKVACRNLSGGGMSVLHSTYLHPETRVTVLLPLQGARSVEMRGKVVRCQHRSGVLHEIGVRFDQPVDVKLFVPRDPFANLFTLENVQPAELTGRVFVLDAHAADRHMLKHYLRETGLVLEIADDLAAVMGKLDGADAVLLSCDLAGGTPIEHICRLRDAGYGGPIVMLVPDRSPATRRRLTGVPVDEVLVRPLEQPLVLRALAEVLLVRNGARRAATSTRKAEAWMVDGLSEIAAELRQAGGSEPQALAASLHRLKELSSAAGWAELGAAAMDLHGRCGTPSPQVAADATKLASLCSSLRDDIRRRLNSQAA